MFGLTRTSNLNGGSLKGVQTLKQSMTRSRIEAFLRDPQREDEESFRKMEGSKQETLDLRHRLVGAHKEEDSFGGSKRPPRGDEAANFVQIDSQRDDPKMIGVKMEISHIEMRKMSSSER